MKHFFSCQRYPCLKMEKSMSYRPFLFHDIAYCDPDTRSANIAPKRVPFQTSSTYLVNRKTSESQNAFPIARIFQDCILMRAKRFKKPPKILFYSMFCLLQTSDERIFWYSRICRNLVEIGRLKWLHVYKEQLKWKGPDSQYFPPFDAVMLDSRPMTGQVFPP